MTTSALLLIVAPLVGGPGPSATPAHTLRGVVFEDANHDGRRDAGEAGIAGVAVSDHEVLAVSIAQG